MEKILKFNTVKHDKIWGNEQWIISAHPNGQTQIVGGKYNNKTLKELFEDNNELFGDCKLKEFPLLVKIISARDNLSVQVHPDDDYALKHESSLGKNECWYILDCKPDSDIVVGHEADDTDEIKQLINSSSLESKLKINKIKKGDFFNIPAGTIHAIRKNTQILEIQQSSDITYRLYDYGRLENGVERELHIDKSLDVIDFNPNVKIEIIIEENEKYLKKQFINNNFFTVEKLEAKNDFKYENKYNFIIGVALNDNARVNDEYIKKYQGFLVPYGQELNITKNSDIYIAYIR